MKINSIECSHLQWCNEWLKNTCRSLWATRNKYLGLHIQRSFFFLYFWYERRKECPISEDFIFWKSVFYFRKWAKNSSRKSCDYPVCQSCSRIWFVHVYGDSEYPSSECYRNWYVATFWEYWYRTFYEEDSQWLQNSNCYLKGEENCLEREISSKFPTNNRRELHWIIWCESWLYTFFLSNPVKSDFRMILLHVLSQIEKRESVSARSATDEDYFFTHILHIIQIFLIKKVA